MDHLSEEMWLDISRCPGYQVSSHGRVRSVRYDVSRVLKPYPVNNGYLVFDYRGKCVYVHHVLAETFIGPQPDGMEVCHRNNDSTNNAAKNLRYDTHIGNMADTVAAGRFPARHGHRNNAAKLTDALAREIYELRGKATQSAVAERYGVCKGTVCGIQQKRIWSHIHAN